MSVEDQFDVAAQDRRADAAKKARLSGLAKDLEQVADEIEAEALAAEQAEEVPEAPKVDQEPELPCCGNPEPHPHEGNG